MGFKVYQEYYYFLKDVQGNVRSVVRAHQNIAQAGFVVDEVVRYEYDAWGNATSSNFNNAKIDGVDVAEFNPIRWKSQYYDTESGLYYINGRYYSPETKRYVDSGNPETALANAATIYGLNLQNSTLTNPVNELYNEYTIETQTALTYAPPELTKWQAFWRSDWGKLLAIGIIVAATILAIMCPAFVPYYLSAAIGTSISLLSGGIIAGFKRWKFLERFCRLHKRRVGVRICNKHDTCNGVIRHKQSSTGDKERSSEMFQSRDACSMFRPSGKRNA